jgi:hypothetical protein
MKMKKHKGAYEGFVGSLWDGNKKLGIIE